MTHLLGSILVPSGVAYILFAIGLALCAWRRTRPYSWLTLAGSGFVAVVFSSGMVASALMSPLEYSQPALTDPRSYAQARYIVVLTGWATDDRDMPLTGRLNPSSAYRILLALELAQDRPDCSIIVSGESQTARIMGDALLKLGIEARRLRIDGKSTSTLESAANLAGMLGSEPFFLVTSGGHMPRAIAATAAYELAAIPAPTDHQLPKRWKDAEIAPSPNLLVVSDLAVHEYLGLLWYRLRSAL